MIVTLFVVNALLIVCFNAWCANPSEASDDAEPLSAGQTDMRAESLKSREQQDKGEPARHSYLLWRWCGLIPKSPQGPRGKDEQLVAASALETPFLTTNTSEWKLQSQLVRSVEDSIISVFLYFRIARCHTCTRVEKSCLV